MESGMVKINNWYLEKNKIFKKNSWMSFELGKKWVSFIKYK